MHTKGSCVSEGGGVLFFELFLSHQIGPVLLWQLCRGSAGWNQVECPLFQEKSRFVKYDNSIWSAYCNKLLLSQSLLFCLFIAGKIPETKPTAHGKSLVEVLKGLLNVQVQRS